MSGMHHLFTATGRALPAPPRHAPSRSSSVMRLPTRRFDPTRDTSPHTPRHTIPKGQRRESQVALYRRAPRIEDRVPEIEYPVKEFPAVEDNVARGDNLAIMEHTYRPDEHQTLTREMSSVKEGKTRSQRSSRPASVVNGAIPANASRGIHTRTSSQRSQRTIVSQRPPSRGSQAPSHTQQQQRGRQSSIRRAGPPSESAYRPNLQTAAASQQRHMEAPPSPRYSTVRSPRSGDDLAERVHRYSTSNRHAPASTSIGGTELLPSLPRLQGQQEPAVDDRAHRTVVRFIDNQPASQRPALEEMLNEYEGREDELCEALTEAYGDEFEQMKYSNPASMMNRATTNQVPPEEDEPRMAQTIILLGNTHNKAPSSCPPAEGDEEAVNPSNYEFDAESYRVIEDEEHDAEEGAYPVEDEDDRLAAPKPTNY